ncbi:MAG: hypothetical protein AB8G22_13080 [Saprospiraceae bacterium]
MNLAQSLLNFLKGKKNNEAVKAPEGFCPNCWGRYEYEEKMFEAVKNENVDINSTNPNLGWVQEYANKHLSAIELKAAGEDLVCQKCKITYRSVDK